MVLKPRFLIRFSTGGKKVNLIHSSFTIPADRTLSLMESIQSTIKNLPYTIAQNLSILCGKIISTKSCVGKYCTNKSKEFIQNHSSRINMEQTHWIT